MNDFETNPIGTAARLELLEKVIFDAGITISADYGGIRWSRAASLYPVDGYCGKRSSKAGLQAGEVEEKEHWWSIL